MVTGHGIVDPTQTACLKCPFAHLQLHVSAISRACTTRPRQNPVLSNVNWYITWHVNTKQSVLFPCPIIPMKISIGFHENQRLECKCTGGFFFLSWNTLSMTNIYSLKNSRRAIYCFININGKLSFASDTEHLEWLNGKRDSQNLVEDDAWHEINGHGFSWLNHV